MADRISRKADALAIQCTQAAAGITGAGATWPAATAPTAVAMTTHATNLNAKLASINTLEAQLSTARQQMKDLIDLARESMTKIDQATDLLYGPDGAQKQNFGLTPSRTPSGWIGMWWTRLCMKCSGSATPPSRKWSAAPPLR